ncbi:hypothetical protein BACCELL_01119 [Bacteroides cellulosilyticus DSM 14838]|uniref:Uncharacterized protein n=1 Tax=Bacteroides cellulosilyticus DSM 14838 TaxID=537012 RepID=E2NA21_9BACE|nr:hypothetical protein BACCELL_01119 [Bacteroides cellulosilyticus DSM 14838]
MISGRRNRKGIPFSHDFTSFSLFLLTFPCLCSYGELTSCTTRKFSVVNKNKNSNKFTA